MPQWEGVASRGQPVKGLGVWRVCVQDGRPGLGFEARAAGWGQDPRGLVPPKTQMPS